MFAINRVLATENNNVVNILKLSLIPQMLKNYFAPPLPIQLYLVYSKLLITGHTLKFYSVN